MIDFTGNFTWVSSTNYDEYLKMIGVGMIQRRLTEKGPQAIEITKASHFYTVKMLTPLKNIEFTFAPGEEFDLATIDGLQVKSTITIDGGTMNQEIIGKGDRTTTAWTVKSDGSLTLVHSAGDVTAIQIFERQ